MERLEENEEMLTMLKAENEDIKIYAVALAEKIRQLEEQTGG